MVSLWLWGPSRLTGYIHYLSIEAMAVRLSLSRVQALAFELAKLLNLLRHRERERITRNTHTVRHRLGRFFFKFRKWLHLPNVFVAHESSESPASPEIGSQTPLKEFRPEVLVPASGHCLKRFK